MDYLLLLSSIVLGALSVFLFKLYEPRHVKLLNAFTGAYLLCLTLLHLLPELYHPHNGAVMHDDLRIGALGTVDAVGGAETEEEDEPEEKPKEKE